jgi:hypothetical protein
MGTQWLPSCLAAARQQCIGQGGATVGLHFSDWASDLLRSIDRLEMNKVAANGTLEVYGGHKRLITIGYHGAVSLQSALPQKRRNPHLTFLPDNSTGWCE